MMFCYEKLTISEGGLEMLLLLCESNFRSLMKCPVNRDSGVCLSVLFLIIG